MLIDSSTRADKSTQKEESELAKQALDRLRVTSAAERNVAAEYRAACTANRAEVQHLQVSHHFQHSTKKRLGRRWLHLWRPCKCRTATKAYTKLEVQAVNTVLESDLQELRQLEDEAAEARRQRRAHLPPAYGKHVRKDICRRP